ncbi:MAG TPA: type IV pili twitching motility protein PilT [Chromatiaceae bacterium]|jgi:twitching motility protein PilU|nr:MAG: PilT/PilU family type 4a pilus ATPase [Thiohalocapsa sp. PB-PSB1]HBG96155.1 type IV pili twitching motility protein PilT [Chromatiaceae bacterium]HCS92170.1 type IV pili twitching motility protein PilT [Chromatiaceae bacterium]
MDLDNLLKMMAKERASDLFITSGRSPSIKVDGVIKSVNTEILTPEETKKATLDVMTPKQRQEFEETNECQFAIHVWGTGRFRISAFVQRNAIGMVIRRIETRIPTLEELRLPDSLRHLCMHKSGIVIFAGGTGAGKSSTLAALMGYRNRMTTGHIISIEDPIEFMHEHDGCIITQREVGVDTQSYEVALRNTLRQAPDVILIGEIRTAEIMRYAIAFSETGHLVLTTMHANTANQALERIINFFPQETHHQILMDLSQTLHAVVAQQLVMQKDGSGRRAVVEVLLNTPRCSDIIRKGELYKLKELMANSGEQGMITFDQTLFDLLQQDVISYEEALRYADSANELRLMVKLKGNPDVVNELAERAEDIYLVGDSSDNVYSPSAQRATAQPAEKAQPTPKPAFKPNAKAPVSQSSEKPSDKPKKEPTDSASKKPIKKSAADLPKLKL